MSDTRAFAPLYQDLLGTSPAGVLPSTTVTPSSASATASGEFSGVLQRNASQQIRIANTTTAWAFVEFGDLGLGSVRAATVAASLPIAPGVVEIVSVPGGVNAASVILAAASTGGTTVIFTRGEGL